MSRHLPDRPNLEFLKNEAKELLADLQRANPDAQLFEAQFSLSRDYGFASWPTLKAHVESLAVSDSALAGGWVANLGLSKRHPSNSFRSARIHFTVSGNTVEIRDEYVEESGKAVRGRNLMEIDGVERETGNGYTISASWLGQRGFETVARKDGEVVGRGTYTVSADGRQLTITDHGGDCIIVLDRLIEATQGSDGRERVG